MGQILWKVGVCALDMWGKLLSFLALVLPYVRKHKTCTLKVFLGSVLCNSQPRPANDGAGGAETVGFHSSWVMSALHLSNWHWKRSLPILYTRLGPGSKIYGGKLHQSSLYEAFYDVVLEDRNHGMIR